MPLQTRSPMKIYVATHNPHKIEEISRILPRFDIVADDPGDVDENAPDFAGNALIKVRAIAARHPGEWCLADDSGLEVRALGGAPGTRSARYAGEPCDTAANNALLMKNMEGVADRRANFTCAIAVCGPDGSEWTVEGRSFGKIASSASGKGGFGYDPYFIPDGKDVSFAELSPDEKNAISHRGRALEKARRRIEGLCPNRFQAAMKLLRIVNLPTVPGDILAGCAAVAAAGFDTGFSRVLAATAASCFMYLYGMADNDIAGCATDSPRRPIPAGEISLDCARWIAFSLLALSAASGVAGRLPWTWWIAQSALLVSIVSYNRFKKPFLMGFCRALNVACGALSVLPVSHGTLGRVACNILPLCAASFAYVVFVTSYASKEEGDEERRAFAGVLVGAVVYLQLAALITFAILFPAGRQMEFLLVAGAASLVALRLFRRMFPKVDAS